MVRQIRITIPHDRAANIRDILQNQSIVHGLEIYNGETSSMIICKVVNKKTDEILQLLARYNVGIGFGNIDVVALTSTKPRIATVRNPKPKTKKLGFAGKKYQVTDRMSYDEMLDFIDGSIHLTFDYLALIAIGATICAGGLLTNSAVNVVASMLVSPLMGPIVGMTFGTIVKDKKMFWVSLRNECLGLFTCWACGVFFGLFVGTFFDSTSDLGPHGKNTEMSSRGSWEGLAWGAATAIPSGLGVALAVSSYTVSALIGVAISAALLPPIVNSGVCLGASFIMYFVPSQSDAIILHHWVKTGCISMGLFLINWILLFLSALVMFRIKNLNYHANDRQFSEKLAQFSKFVDESPRTGHSFPSSNNIKDRDRAVTTQVNIQSVFSGGAANNTSSSTMSVGFETNMQSTASILLSGETLQTPLLESVSLQSYSNPASENGIMTITNKNRSKSNTALKSGSTKAAFGGTYDFPSAEEENQKRIMRKKSHSTSNVNDLIASPSYPSAMKDLVKLTQSAETGAVQKNGENINPLQLRKGSK